MLKQVTCGFLFFADFLNSRNERERVSVCRFQMQLSEQRRELQSEFTKQRQILEESFQKREETLETALQRASR